MNTKPTLEIFTSNVRLNFLLLKLQSLQSNYKDHDVYMSEQNNDLSLLERKQCFPY